jgi:hypothetical protein
MVQTALEKQTTQSLARNLMMGGVKNVANTCQERAQTQLHNQ